VFALLREAHVTEREERLTLYRWILADPSVNSTNDLGEYELKLVADLLEKWQREGELEFQARQHTGGR
jgi:hypothetical protein